MGDLVSYLEQTSSTGLREPMGGDLALGREVVAF